MTERFDTALPQPARILYQSNLALVGVWRCARTARCFRNSGPARNHYFVFPRTAVRIRRPNGDDVFADPTRVMLYNRGDEYERIAISDRGDESDLFAVAPDVLVEAVHRVGPPLGDERRPFAVTNMSISNALYLEQRQLVNRLNCAEPIESLEVDESVLAILDTLIASACDSGRGHEASERHVRLANGVRAAVAQRVTECLRLTTLAAEYRVSPWFLAKVFRRVTGMTIHAYQNRLRLNLALERVLDRQDLVLVALDLGYSSHSHFTAAFRRAFGLTPTAYRTGRRTGF